MVVKAALFLPNLLSWHGAGRWALSLARHSDPARLQWTGAAIGGFGYVDQAGCEELRRWMPLYSDPPAREWRDEGKIFRCKDLGEAIAQAADGAEVLITWGSGKVLTFLNLPPIPLVLVSHVTNWWPSEGQDKIQHYAAVSEAAAVPFRHVSKEVRVIHNGVEPERVAPRDPERFRAKIPGLEGKRVLGYLGRHDASKDPAVLLEYLRDPDNVLLAMGRPIAGVSPLKGHERVHLLPPQNVVGDFLRVIDVLVHPASEEAFGLTIAEAWLAGTPVCCNTVGIVKELEAQHGVLRWPLNADLSQVQRADSRVAMAKDITWQTFTAGAMAERWADYLEEIAGEPFRCSTPASAAPAEPTVTIAPATWIQPGGDTRRWKIAVTTAPRKKATLQATLRSMQRAGFPVPDIYVDGPNTYKVPWGKIVRGMPHPRGPWNHWLTTLRGLYADDPAADVYGIFQDDVRFCRDVYGYLARMLWPRGAKVCSIYTPQCCAFGDTLQQPGFREVSTRCQIAVGALAYLFPRETVQAMLADPKFTEYAGPATIDTHVGNWAKSIHYHFPSLAEHTGKTSTIYSAAYIKANEKARTAYRFPGPRMSAMSFLHWPDARTYFPVAPRVMHPWPDEHQIAAIGVGQRQWVDCDVMLPYDTTSVPWTVAAVESILNQAYVNPVIHLIADQVPQEAQRPIREALRDVPSIRWYETKCLLGPYRATNAVFDYMETGFFAVQDSDDISSPNRIWRSVQVLQETGYDVFGGTVENFVDYRAGDEFAHRWLQAAPTHYSGVFWLKSRKGGVIHGAMTVRRAFFERINGYSNLACGADCEFNARTDAMGGKTFVSDQVCSFRRLRGSGLSGQSAKGAVLDEDEFTLKRAEQWQAAWAKPNCDVSQYGSLDAFRDGLDLVRLRREKL